MVTKKPRIVIIGAGMAGLTAAHKLHTTAKEVFELCVVEGGTRIGGRINTSEFGGDRIEMGATWIHGILGSPVHKIAQEINSLESDQPWECMDSSFNEAVTIAEGGYEVNPYTVKYISNLFEKLMLFAQGKQLIDQDQDQDHGYNKESSSTNDHKLSITARNGTGPAGRQGLSLGSYLRQGLEAYWDSSTKDDQEELKGGYGNGNGNGIGPIGNWSRKLVEEAIFAMHENIQRTYTSAGDLLNLDYVAESEYILFPGEEITIAKGYISIIESLASVLPSGSIQLGRKVSKIQWNCCDSSKPVKLHFSDGSVMLADHVIVTVSLGVLKAGICEDSGMFFDPPLPSFKKEAISRLGFGVVNKLFLQLSTSPNQNHDDDQEISDKFPFLQMVFHQSDSELKNPKIPWWMRRTASLCPIYGKSNVLLSWFAGKEALELESLEDEEINNGVSETISSFFSNSQKSSSSCCNATGNGNGNGNINVNSSVGNTNNYKGRRELKFSKVLKTKWGNDPLFLGSYSYVAVGSSGDDMDTMAEPLPNKENHHDGSSSLQILFAGEATHRTHYSTTHGAYFSGLREADRLIQHYHYSLGV